MASCLLVDVVFEDYFGHQFTLKRICSGFFDQNILPLTQYYHFQPFIFDNTWIYDKRFNIEVYDALDSYNLVDEIIPELSRDRKRLLQRIRVVTNGW